jgi:hypothetical protein
VKILLLNNQNEKTQLTAAQFVAALKNKRLVFQPMRFAASTAFMKLFFTVGSQSTDKWKLL